MTDLSALVEQAKQSTLFTAPVFEGDLARFLRDEADNIRALARQTLRDRPEHIFWVGSGNSWCNLYSGKYLLDHYTDIASDYYMSYELIWRNPQRLNEKSLAIFASFSGGTEDTLAALKHAKSKGARTIAIVNEADSPMGKLADTTIAYNSKALYIMPLAVAYLFALEMAAGQGADVQAVIDDVLALPPVLGKLYEDEESKAQARAETYKDEALFYALGSGPLYGLAYKFALTVFMENMRVHGSFMETSEFRHGPVEMLDKHQPAMVFLLGTDASRPTAERVLETVKQAGAKTIVYDMADYPDLHPLLAPFVLMVPLQWFIVYSTLLRGITDLDERVFMGRGLLGKGDQVTWP